MADCDVFREQLSIKYSSYGHALWEPSPAEPTSPVKVGDVGFIRSGKFHCLFNALLSAEDQSDVPEHYEQLVPNFSRHISTGTLSSNHYCSDGIVVELESNVQALGPDDFEKVTFSNSRRRGAVLSLPVDARREDTLAKGDFGQWMVKQIDRWFAFARGLGLGIERMEEIILVTGCDHTRSWTNIAFFGSQSSAQASFGVKVVHGPAVSINWQPSPERVQGAVLHRGPGGTNLPEDQCVFIRGFGVARRFRILPKNLRAAAGSSSDPDGYDGEPDIEAVSLPAAPEYQDPLHILQDYVAERVPDCDMILVHDDDLVTIDEVRHGASPESFEPDVMMDLLRKSNIEIHKDLCDLSPTNSLSQSTDMAIVKVAMLSKTFQNWNTASASQRSLPTARNVDLAHTSKSRRTYPPAPSQGQNYSDQSRNILTPKNPAIGDVPPVTRHSHYFVAAGDVTFKVENTLFRVHKYFFIRGSSYFQSLLRAPLDTGNDPPGSSEANPVVLEDTTSEAFASFCWIFYNPKYSTYTTTVEKWVEILALAQKWEFKEVEQLCIRELENLPISPVEKINIFQEHHLDQSRLAKSFEELALRPEPLTLEEGLKLGMATAIQIAHARERSRGFSPNTRSPTVQMNNSELRSVIQDVFGIKPTVRLLDGSTHEGQLQLNDLRSLIQGVFDLEGESPFDFLTSPPPYSAISDNPNHNREPKKS